MGADRQPPRAAPPPTPTPAVHLRSPTRFLLPSLHRPSRNRLTFFRRARTSARSQTRCGGSGAAEFRRPPAGVSSPLAQRQRAFSRPPSLCPFLLRALHLSNHRKPVDTAPAWLCPFPTRAPHRSLRPRGTRPCSITRRARTWLAHRASAGRLLWGRQAKHPSITRLCFTSCGHLLQSAPCAVHERGWISIDCFL